MEVLHSTSWSLSVAIMAMFCATIYTIVYLLRGSWTSRTSSIDKKKRTVNQLPKNLAQYLNCVKRTCCIVDCILTTLSPKGIDVKVFYGTQTGTAKVSRKLLSRQYLCCTIALFRCISR